MKPWRCTDVQRIATFTSRTEVAGVRMEVLAYVESLESDDHRLLALSAALVFSAIVVFRSGESRFIA